MIPFFAISCILGGLYGYCADSLLGMLKSLLFSPLMIIAAVGLSAWCFQFGAPGYDVIGLLLFGPLIVVGTSFGIVIGLCTHGLLFSSHTVRGSNNSQLLTTLRPDGHSRTGGAQRRPPRTQCMLAKPPIVNIPRLMKRSITTVQ